MIGCLTETTTCEVAKSLVSMNPLVYFTVKLSIKHLFVHDKWFKDVKRSWFISFQVKDFLKRKT